MTKLQDGVVCYPADRPALPPPSRRTTMPCSDRFRLIAVALSWVLCGAWVAGCEAPPESGIRPERPLQRELARTWVGRPESPSTDLPSRLARPEHALRIASDGHYSWTLVAPGEPPDLVLAGLLSRYGDTLVFGDSAGAPLARARFFLGAQSHLVLRFEDGHDIVFVADTLRSEMSTHGQTQSSPPRFGRRCPGPNR